MKILSVDDVQLVRKMIRGAVEALGGDFLEASNGLEALATLEKTGGDVDLVLLDWNMPKMSGLEFLNIVKSNSKLKHIPVIMVTTANEKDKIIKAIQSGASNYLVKPFTEQDLTKKILECLGSGYERLNRCFFTAVREVIGAAAGLEMLESDGGPEEKSKQQGHFFGQILVLGQINAVVLLTMNRETAAGIVGKSPAELNNEKMVGGIAEMVNMVAARAGTLLAGSNIQLNITNAFAFAGIISESRYMLYKKKAYTAFRKYRAGDMEVSLKVYYL